MLMQGVPAPTDACEQKGLQHSAMAP